MPDTWIDERLARDALDVAFDRGAAPITLIDGDTLVQLLITHGIGVKQRNIELWSLDPGASVGGDDDEVSRAACPGLAEGP